LEVEINGKQFVIERNLFSSDSKVRIHECALKALNIEHPIEVVQSRHLHNKDSISSYILEKLGLSGTVLKEAPKKEGSGVDTLSFRDLMWYSFLKNERLDSKDLLFEKDFMKHIKLLQVFDIIFKVHANEKANLSFQIKTIEFGINKIKNEIETVTSFLHEQKIPSLQDLNSQLLSLSNQEEKLKKQLQHINTTLKGESEIAQELRTNLFHSEQKTKKMSVVLRDRETLLKRLLPLRGQYSEEIKKLYFLQEAKTIFNPLGIVRCPYCFEVISDSNDETCCNLCKKPLSVEPDQSFNIDKEIRIIETKLKELNSFILEVGIEIDDISLQIQHEDKEIRTLRNRLDEATREYISPYIAERDAVVGGLSRVSQEIIALNNHMSLHNGLQNRIQIRLQLEDELNMKRVELNEEDRKRESKEDIIKEISNRFEEILNNIGFPKLTDSKIKDDLTPIIRGQNYQKVGSSGALTLISISWFLSIFEKAIESGGHHPGFIMIDGIQKNIGIGAREEEKEFRDVKIVDGLYRHIINKTLAYGTDAQIILVDNEPPTFAEEYISVKFSRRKDSSSYGLIDDETD
jgi:hypothetical protein